MQVLAKPTWATQAERHPQRIKHDERGFVWAATRHNHALCGSSCGRCGGMSFLRSGRTSPPKQQKSIWSDETHDGYRASSPVVPACKAAAAAEASSSVAMEGSTIGPETSVARSEASQFRLRTAVGRALLYARVNSMPDLKLDGSGRIQNYKVVGKPWSENLDLFHYMMHRSMPFLLLGMLVLYALLATLFALAYMIEPHCIRNLVSDASVGSFDDVFYFSVQTLSTIGYGSLIPQTHFANMLSLIESFMGLAFAALFAGVFFAKLSAPVARIAFTKYAVTLPHDGRNTMQFRVCNQRDTQIVKASAQACVLIKEVSLEGQTSYVYKELKLEQQSIPVFTAGWRLRHVIDESSPLHGINATNAKELGIAAIHAVVSGVEEVYGQHVFERHTFLPDYIKFNHNFVRMFEEVSTHHHGPTHHHAPKTQLRFHLNRIHMVEKFQVVSAMHIITKMAKQEAKQKRKSEDEATKKSDEIMSRISQNAVQHNHMRRESTSTRCSQGDAAQHTALKLEPPNGSSAGAGAPTPAYTRSGGKAPIGTSGGGEQRQTHFMDTVDKLDV